MAIVLSTRSRLGDLQKLQDRIARGEKKIETPTGFLSFASKKRGKKVSVTSTETLNLSAILYTAAKGKYL